MEAIFSAPSKEDYTDLGEKWLSMQDLVQDEYGYELCQSFDDLDYLQKVIDDELIDFKNWYALECLGVAFGRVIAKNNETLDWWPEIIILNV